MAVVPGRSIPPNSPTSTKTIAGSRFTGPAGVRHRRWAEIDISEVIPGLYIASRFYPVDDEMPDSVPIDCAAVLEDSPEQSTMPIEVLARVTFGLLHDGLAVTLFCDAGRNRSAVVAARALIIRGHDPTTAITMVRKARSHLQGGCLTNEAFVEYLLRAPS